jgi:hypothetical protein
MEVDMKERKPLIGWYFKAFITLAVLCSLLSLSPANSGDDAEETVITVTGELTVLYADDFDHKRSKILYELKDTRSKKRYNLHFARKPSSKWRTGAIITVRGKAKGRNIYLEANGDENTETVLPQESAIAGEQKTIIIVANFIDENVSCPVADIEDSIFTDPNQYSVDNLYQEMSFGQIWFKGAVVGPYLIDYNTTDPCNISAWADAADTAAQTTGIDLSTYNRKVYVMPKNNGCGYIGVGTVGGNPSRAWNFRCEIDDIYAHELGHNLGMHHASTPGNQYGDISDIMGYSGIGLRQINAPHHEQMGWLPPILIQDIISGGIYDISPLELNASDAFNPQIIKIAKSDTDEFYYLSYRQPIGFDSILTPYFLQGVNIHRHKGDGFSTRTFLLDSLGDGESFIDIINGVTITQISHSDQDLSVLVEFDSTPVCIPGTPTVSVTPNSQSGVPGTKRDYTVSVTNMDSTDCSQSTFTLSDSIPGGWTGTLSPDTLVLSPETTGQATLSVTSSGNASEGTYGVIVNVSDTAEPAHTASGSANYVVLATCSPSAPAVSLSPASQGASAGSTLDYTVSVTNMDSADCSPATFSLSRSIPGGWTGTLSPDTLVLSPETTGQATLSVTSSGNASEGTYGVTVDVSDTAEPSHTASGSANYVVLATCSPSAPAVSLSPASQGASAGSTLDYTVSVTNMDSADCSQSTFALSDSIPGGWISTLSHQSVTVPPGQTDQATLSVTSSSNASEGTYKVSVQITDSLESTHTASGSADYVVLVDTDTEPPTAPTGLSASIKRKHVVLSWNASTDNVGVTGYQVLRDGIVISETGETKFNDHSISAGPTYVYSVTAYDAAGNISAESNQVTVTVSGSGNKGGGGGKGRVR